ncbi:3-hydroxyisobutyrate dehydrogenase [Marinicella sp. S1101]|uniref:3-hydroxyisobutyrate dehydrogenase n=1 Tax=Marinicella marina TaxID=2996016 RepID=UPI00226094A0|nr:3-hydroxyisobutyrate dehydrogenase [Marinicella marina]MCX7553824.1 3-hydroxyisobutyrate dehydrogenase [Marinicella marina]MDJ1140900.1 3-hydroxyisobutyrate dehydrogenase [Marinicella marina]
MTQNIAFIGLGNMGGPMAKNLIKNDFNVTVYDLNATAVAELKAAGADTANNAKSAVANADVIISMLPNGAIVKSLYTGPNGLINEVKDEVLIIDSSTIAADDARAVAKACEQKGIAMIDAPVSGGTAAAEAGTLTFICGGEKADFEAAKSILSAMGRHIFHAGASGAGQVAKICNNMLLAIHMIGTAEALNMGAQQGLDPAVMSDIMKASSGNNWSLQVYNPYPDVMPNVPSSKDYQGGFMVDLMSKDLGLSQELAAKSKSATPLGAMATQLYQIHQAGGAGGLDFSSILKLLQNKK